MLHVTRTVRFTTLLKGIKAHLRSSSRTVDRSLGGLLENMLISVKIYGYAESVFPEFENALPQRETDIYIGFLAQHLSNKFTYGQTIENNTHCSGIPDYRHLNRASFITCIWIFI